MAVAAGNPVSGINSKRLWDSLMQIGQIGSTPKGGCCRLALTELDKRARDLFVNWCEEAGCTIAVDSIGNIFARRAGRDNNLPAVLTGSHLDTQPTGGKFDGIYGVLAGLEVIRTLNDQGITTAAPLEVAVWTNEEGYRYDPAMLGSGVYAGVFELADALAIPGNDGSVLGHELERIGYAGETLAPPEQRHAAYFEAHIEQGPVLEQNGNVVGVVTAGQGIQAAELNIRGQEAHAGPTPMDMRSDALLPAARIVTEVNRIAASINNARGTVGDLRVLPGSRNVIPAEVQLSVDLRHPDQQVMDNMYATLRDFVAELARTEHPECQFEWQNEWQSPVIPFAEELVATVRNAAAELGYRHQDIVSGAGHDACYVAQVVPTAMIFVPCEGGISHNEKEMASPDDLAAGCNVLLQSMVNTAGA